MNLSTSSPFFVARSASDEAIQKATHTGQVVPRLPRTRWVLAMAAVVVPPKRETLTFEWSRFRTGEPVSTSPENAPSGQNLTLGTRKDRSPNDRDWWEAVAPPISGWRQLCASSSSFKIKFEPPESSHSMPSLGPQQEESWHRGVALVEKERAPSGNKPCPLFRASRGAGKKLEIKHGGQLRARFLVIEDDDLNIRCCL